MSKFNLTTVSCKHLQLVVEGKEIFIFNPESNTCISHIINNEDFEIDDDKSMKDFEESFKNIVKDAIVKVKEKREHINNGKVYSYDDKKEE